MHISLLSLTFIFSFIITLPTEAAENQIKNIDLIPLITNKTHFSNKIISSIQWINNNQIVYNNLFKECNIDDIALNTRKEMIFNNIDGFRKVDVKNNHIIFSNYLSNKINIYNIKNQKCTNIETNYPFNYCGSIAKKNCILIVSHKTLREYNYKNNIDKKCLKLNKDTRLISSSNDTNTICTTNGLTVSIYKNGSQKFPTHVTLPANNYCNSKLSSNNLLALFYNTQKFSQFCLVNCDTNEPHTIETTNSFIYDCCFSPTGKIIVLLSKENNDTHVLQYWNTTNLKLIGQTTLQHINDEIFFHLDISPDGTKLAVTLNDEYIIYEIPTEITQLY